MTYGKLILAANRPEKAESRVIGGKEEMIAVVDAEPKRRLEIGAATAACLGGKLMHDDFSAPTYETYRRCQPGKTSAHDMNRSAHQTKP